MFYCYVILRMQRNISQQLALKTHWQNKSWSFQEKMDRPVLEQDMTKQNL
jgi:hypothetical protein